MHIANEDNKYNTSEHLVYSCQYHVIFCPKYRRSIFTPPYDSRLKEIFLEIADKWNFSILDMEVMPDHVHMIIDCNPRFGIVACVAKLKGASAHQMFRMFPELKKRLPCLWTRSCFISSVGSVSLEVVKRYIDNQKDTAHKKEVHTREQSKEAGKDAR